MKSIQNISVDFDALSLDSEELIFVKAKYTQKNQLAFAVMEDALIQPYSGHESRKSLEIYSRLSIGDAQEEYENAIEKFPV